MNVLDPARLGLLGEELPDGRCAAVFAECYLGMLAGRVDQILRAAAAGNAEAALDRILSLKISSATVGTVELAGLAAALELTLRSRGVAALAGEARALAPASSRAAAALRAHLAQTDSIR